MLASRFVEADAVQPKIETELGGIVHILACGSVDDGKSTLIGRLLWDTGELFDDQRTVMEQTRDAGCELDYSRLVDGLIAEREQGITIDIAWRYVDAEHRRLVVIDAPGHEQYTRNMASGASHADVALVLCDARAGIKPQTLRHTAILNFVGVRRIILVVNKMDLIDWDARRFRAIEEHFKAVAAGLAFDDVIAVPVSAKFGDNVVRASDRLGWYAGPTVLEAVGRVEPRSGYAMQPFRFPVQSVLREGNDFRGLAGTIAAGRIATGDIVRDSESGREARIERIVTMDGDLHSAGSGRAVVLTLDRDIDVARGALLCRPAAPTQLAREIDVHLVWLADEPLQPSHRLLFRTTNALVPVADIAVTARLDLETLGQLPAITAEPNDIVRARIDLARAAPIDIFDEVPATGCFVLVDALTGATVAGGVIRSHVEATDDQGADAFQLNSELLESGLCAGLAPSDPEYRRRADEAAILLKAAGVRVRLSSR